MKKRIIILISLILMFILISCTKETRTVPDEGRVYYEIFVRSFADSNGDGIGDFNGITDKLDYLEDLGVKGIWLMPIFPSPSYHGYDVTDYKSVNQHYGSMIDFEKLIEEAHKRDIKIIIDFVINHTSTKHTWFKQAKDENSSYHKYYRFKQRNEVKTGPWYPNSINGGSSDDFYYAYFWDQMPDLNFDNKQVEKEMINIAKFWIEKGVDGFRFDAALHIFSPDELYNQNEVLLNANVQFWEDFNKQLKNLKKDVYLVGEVWISQSTVSLFYKGLDSNFNFDLADKIITTVKKTGDLYYAKQIQQMNENIKKYNEQAIDAPFLTNHDQTRIMTKLGNDISLVKLSAEMLLTLKGNPFIYYGEEIGMKGDKPDEYIRLPFKWDGINSTYDTSWILSDINKDIESANEQFKNPNSLFNHYKTLIHLRNDYKALSIGEFKYLKSDTANLIMFIRVSEKYKQSLLVVHNLSKNEFTSSLKDASDLKIIYESSVNQGLEKLVFSPKSTKVFQIPFDKYESYLT